MKQPGTWAEMATVCRGEATKMGHVLGKFACRAATPSVRMAMCETCYGGCWIALDHNGRFSFGGRLVRYQCGTHEAAGTLPTPATSPEKGGEFAHDGRYECPSAILKEIDDLAARALCEPRPAPVHLTREQLEELTFFGCSPLGTQDEIVARFEAKLREIIPGLEVTE